MVEEERGKDEGRGQFLVLFLQKNYSKVRNSISFLLQLSVFPMRLDPHHDYRFPPLGSGGTKLCCTSSCSKCICALLSFFNNFLNLIRLALLLHANKIIVLLIAMMLCMYCEGIPPVLYSKILLHI